MARDNNNARKKQKKTVAFDGNGDDSLSLPAPVVVVPALCFGNILKEFPDFLFCVLTYIADRVVWNSIAFSSKDMHAKSRAILPPWPLWYKLPSSDDSDTFMAWSLCGTRIAYKVLNSNIAIVDQRRGPFRNNRNNNNDLGWEAHDDGNGESITDLAFSPDGSFLVSIGYDSFIRLWNTTTGNYEQLQEWNMAVEFPEELSYEPKVSISSCSKYIVASVGSCVVIKDVDGNTIKSLPFAPNGYIQNVVFSSDNHAVLMCCWEGTGICIKVWRPYLDDDEEDRFVTLTRQTDSTRYFRPFTFSNDTTMIAIHDMYAGALWSINSNHNCLTQESEFQSEFRRAKAEITIYFTADDRYIVCNTLIGPTFWSIAEHKFSDTTTHVFNCSNTTKLNLRAFSFSPNNRQVVVSDSSTHNLYITSYFVQ